MHESLHPRNIPAIYGSVHLHFYYNYGSNIKSCYLVTIVISLVRFLAPHLTDVVAAGGSDGLVDHLLTHDAVECLLDTTQQTSLKERTM